jgi:hypothetical protein
MSDDPYWQVVLDHCADEYTGLWLAVAELRMASGGAIDFRRILDILYGLLSSGLLQAGIPTLDGGFEPWLLAPEEVLARIEDEWTLLGRDPDIGEIVWFTMSEKAVPHTGHRPAA